MGETTNAHRMESSTALLLLAVAVGCGGGETKGEGLDRNAGAASGAGGSGGMVVIGTGGAIANGGKGATVGDAGTGDSGGTSGSSGMVPITVKGCTVWELGLAPDTESTATLTDGGLVLFHPGGSPLNESYRNDIELTQRGLTGDFDVAVAFDSFQQGDTGALKGMMLQVAVSGADADGSVAMGMVGAQTADVELSTETVDDRSGLNRAPDPTWLDDASGKIEFSMRDGIITANTLVGDYYGFDTSAVPFDATTFDLWLGIVIRGSGVGELDSSVRITSVTITGGGGSVKSDTFDCTP